MSIGTLTSRVLAVERRLGDIETGYGETIYKMDRRLVRVELLLAAVAEHLGVPAPTDEQVEQILEES